LRAGTDQKAAISRIERGELATPHGGIEVLHEAPGAAPYDQLRERALTIALDDLRVQVAGLDDLIRMKLDRGRGVDRADVAALTALEVDPEIRGAGSSPSAG
jgi:hypothetical protein